MQRPNEFISGGIMSHYIVTSLSAHGDAFLLKVKNNKRTSSSINTFNAFLCKS